MSCDVKESARSDVVYTYMYMNFMHYAGPGAEWGAGFGLPFVASAILFVALWSLLWKGLALWRAAKRGDMWWFIAFLLLNTLGILEIIYLFVVTGAKLSDFTKKLTHNGHSN